MIMLRGGLGSIGQLFAFLWMQKLWWLFPVIVLLLLFALLIVLGNATGLGPLIYPLF